MFLMKNRMVQRQKIEDKCFFYLQLIGLKIAWTQLNAIFALGGRWSPSALWRILHTNDSLQMDRSCAIYTVINPTLKLSSAERPADIDLGLSFDIDSRAEVLFLHWLIVTYSFIGVYNLRKPLFLNCL